MVTFVLLFFCNILSYRSRDEDLFISQVDTALPITQYGCSTMFSLLTTPSYVEISHKVCFVYSYLALWLLLSRSDLEESSII